MKGRKEALDAYRRGALDEAIAIQQRVIAQKDPSPEARDFLLLSLVLHAKKDFAAATAVLRDGLKRHPNSADIHENLGVLLIAVKDYPGAVAALERALELGSQSLNVHDSLCNALARVASASREHPGRTVRSRRPGAPSSSRSERPSPARSDAPSRT